MTNRWDALDKGTIHILGGQGKTAQDFIRLLRTVYNLKLMNYLFLEFSIYYFQTTVDCRSLKPWKVKLQIRGYYCMVPGEGNGNPLQYPCLENPIERGAWQATAHRAAESKTRLSD